ASCSRSARCSATPPAGTPTPRTTAAISRRRPARPRWAGGRPPGCSWAAWSWRSPAPHRPRPPARARRSTTPPGTFTGLHDAGAKYTAFLLIISYWIAPWLAVMFCDQFLYRRRSLAEEEVLLFDRHYTNWAGPVAMVVGVVVSVWLFSNQLKYVGVVPTPFPSLVAITFEAGFVITAVVYLAWHAIPRSGAGGRAPAAVTPGRRPPGYPPPPPPRVPARRSRTPPGPGRAAPPGRPTPRRCCGPGPGPARCRPACR